MKKLSAIAFEHLKSPTLTPEDAYIDELSRFVAKRGYSEVDRARLAALLPLVRERALSFADAAEALDYFFRDLPIYDEKSVKKVLGADKAPALEKARGLFASIDDFSAKNLDTKFHEFIQTNGLEIKDVAQPVRVAVTGRSASPGLFDVLALVGKERVLSRIDHAVGLCRSAAS
jgi:glutamyl-tRNA synthetase